MKKIIAVNSKAENTKVLETTMVNFRKLPMIFCVVLLQQDEKTPVGKRLLLYLCGNEKHCFTRTMREYAYLPTLAQRTR
jgi:hypothetical protein